MLAAAYTPTQVNAVDCHARSALHYAAGQGHAAVVEVLWAGGADMDAVDADRQTGMVFIFIHI